MKGQCQDVDRLYLSGCVSLWHANRTYLYVFETTDIRIIKNIHCSASWGMCNPLMTNPWSRQAVSMQQLVFLTLCIFIFKNEHCKNHATTSASSIFRTASNSAFWIIKCVPRWSLNIFLHFDGRCIEFLLFWHQWGLKSSGYKVADTDSLHLTLLVWSLRCPWRARVSQFV